LYQDACWVPVAIVDASCGSRAGHAASPRLRCKGGPRGRKRPCEKAASDTRASIKSYLRPGVFDCARFSLDYSRIQGRGSGWGSRKLPSAALAIKCGRAPHVFQLLPRREAGGELYHGGQSTRITNGASLSWRGAPGADLESLADYRLADSFLRKKGTELLGRKKGGGTASMNHRPAFSTKVSSTVARLLSLDCRNLHEEELQEPRGGGARDTLERDARLRLSGCGTDLWS